MAVHSNRSAYGPFDDGELVGKKRTDSTGEDAEDGMLEAYYRGLKNYQYYVGGVPYYKYSIMGLKTLF